MNLKQRVKLDRTYEPPEFADQPDITGTIVGLGHKVSSVTQPVYLVELDQPFYDPTKRISVSILVVARDNLFPIICSPILNG